MNLRKDKQIEKEKNEPNDKLNQIVIELRFLSINISPFVWNMLLCEWKKCTY